MEHIDILIINPPFHTRNGSGNFFPLGLGYIISSVIAHGYTWRVIDCTKIIRSFYYNELCRLEDELFIELQKYSPLIVSIGPCITSQLRALKIIFNCCQKVLPTTPIIAGGPLASIEGQEWLFYEEFKLDYIIKGDGELAIPNAIKTIKDTGSIANSAFLSKSGYNYINEITDINSILFPYRELHTHDTFSTRRSFSGSHQAQAAMITSRGCPYSCNYCVSGNLKRSKSVRKRSVKNIVQEMDLLQNKYGIDDVVFYDDCFFFNAKTVSSDLTSFCKTLLNSDIKMTWQIELRPDLLLAIDDISINLLEYSGCRQINIGIEKVSKAGLKFLGKPNYLAGLRQKIFQIKKISKINLSATFILGGGAETSKDIINLVEKSKGLGLDFAHYNPLFVYPGTPLYQQIFDNDQAWKDHIYNDSLPWGEIVFESDFLKCGDLIDLVDYAYTEFYKNTEHASKQMIVDRFNIKSKGN